MLPADLDVERRLIPIGSLFSFTSPMSEMGTWKSSRRPSLEPAVTYRRTPFITCSVPQQVGQKAVLVRPPWSCTTIMGRVDVRWERRARLESPAAAPCNTAVAVGSVPSFDFAINV